MPLTTFRRCVARYNGERKVKHFSCLDQFLCLAFAQLTWRESLRDIEACLNAQASKLLGRVSVHGRGGTVLQPGLDKLVNAADFPKDAPILIITDGACDTLTIRREHAFLMPEGARLPFRTAAPMFHFEAA